MAMKLMENVSGRGYFYQDDNNYAILNFKELATSWDGDSLSSNDV